MAVLKLSGTLNSEPQGKSHPEAGSDSSLSFLHGTKLAYALNLVRDWHADLLHYQGLKPGSAKLHRDNLLRLLNHARVAPWELQKDHVTRYFESRVNQETGQMLAPATVGTYCAAWRGFQNYMLTAERVNELFSEFNVRPKAFVDDDNSIAVKRHKLNWVPKGWALTDAEIDAIDETFRSEIARAAREHSKSLLPLLRDRVMFHVGIHFALRISELTELRVSSFCASLDADLQHFGKWGVLTVTGKGDVTGSVPMRDPSVHGLIEWYTNSVRQKILLRRKSKTEDDGRREIKGQMVSVSDLMFPSERGGVVCPNGFRKRLADIAMKSGVLRRKLTPHTLRHTGCTLMVPLYSPEIAQKYMRHKHLHTTLYYYHPTPLGAANEVNSAAQLFDDEEED